MSFKIIKASKLDALKFEEGMFEGYGSTYGNVDLVGDIIEKGAFDDSIKNNSEIKLFYGHDYSIENILGKASVKSDDNGLIIKGEIDQELPHGRTALRLLRKGILDSMSIGFSVQSDGYKFNKDGLRVFTKAQLNEVSIVPFPANPKALISRVKSEGGGLPPLKDFEEFLRDSGFSTKEALVIASHGYRSLIKEKYALDEVTELLKNNTEILRKKINESRGNEETCRRTASVI